MGGAGRMVKEKIVLRIGENVSVVQQEQEKKHN